MLVAALGLMLAAPLSATTLQHDLGRGLVYMRVNKVPADLPVRSQAPAIVLDLRFARGDAIRDWLTTYAAPQTPIFVLANTATQKALRRSIQGIAGALTIGISGEDFAPDIALNISADEEKRAYEALALTENINTLLYPANHKERYDEAAMIKANIEPRKIDAPSQNEALVEDLSPAPLIDQAILRAVQIHRGWLVLRSR